MPSLVRIACKHLTMRYCEECGKSIQNPSNFCPWCGKPLETASSEDFPEAPEETLAQENTHTPMVPIPLHERRCHPGALNDAIVAAGGDVEKIAIYQDDYSVEEGSIEHRFSGTPFDSSTPPHQEDWIPIDSVWAVVPYPGKFPGDVRHRRMANRAAAMGTLVGRPRTELEKVLGSPASMSDQGELGYVLTWQELSVFGGMYMLTLRMDPWGVCMGILGETSV